MSGVVDVDEALLGVAGVCDPYVMGFLKTSMASSNLR